MDFKLMDIQLNAYISNKMDNDLIEEYSTGEFITIEKTSLNYKNQISCCRVENVPVLKMEDVIFTFPYIQEFVDDFTQNQEGYFSIDYPKLLLMLKTNH